MQQFFPTLVVNLLHHEEMSLCHGSKTNHYRNAVYFTYSSPTSPGVILLEDCTHWISLYLSNTIKDFVCIRNILVRACHEAQHQLKLSCTLKEGLYCQCKISQHQSHLCTQINESNIYTFQCFENPLYTRIESDPERLKWFQGLYYNYCNGSLMYNFLHNYRCWY